MAPVNVMIVENEGLYREMLRMALSSQSRIKVVGTASNGPEALRLFETLQPDVVLMDIELGSEPNGIQTAHRIKDKKQSTGIVILSMHYDRQYIASIPMDRASGWSYLLKQNIEDIGALVRAIEGAVAGMVVMDPAVVSGLKPRPNSAVERLTTRQREVLELIAQGYNNSGIAEKLVIGEKAVENYINSIFQELAIDRQAPIHPRVKAVLTYLQETKAA